MGEQVKKYHLDDLKTYCPKGRKLTPTATLNYSNCNGISRDFLDNRAVKSPFTLCFPEF